ncbi:site-specific integrase [Flagellimonas myxillae]|uniref:site-specific integrase n=1 Tax=Flagellimonas myxillae TaxID=2942214 RepID=UPI00201F423C|nr:site-specific integrase [Muricauda myxillae]MCL6266382.1 site-specific integrase [Muricauda myxillae]
MRTSKTFTILFWQKIAKKKRGIAPIYARITVDGKRAEISLGIQFPMDSWNRKMSRAEGRTVEARALNQDLDTIYTELADCYKQLKKEGRFVTAQSVKARYLGTDHNNETLFGLYNYHYDKNQFKLAPGTLKNYGSTKKYLEHFLAKKFKASDIPLTYIQYSFIVDFELFLRNPENHLDKAKPLKNNGIMKHIERLNKLMGFAEKLDWIVKHPFEKYQLSYTKYKSGFLTKNQLEAFENIELNDSKLVRVRDVFVFCCYTGLAYIDVKMLTDENIVMGIDGNMWLFLYREKSAQPVKIPILDKAKAILDKYDCFENSNRLLPVCSNQKMNAYLKEIATLCSIDFKVTCHVARHTFATTVTLSNGVPIATVSKLLGHAKLSTTQIYANVVERKLQDDMNKLQNTLNSDRESA